MRGAVACVEEMEADGIVPNEATFSVVISGYGKLGNVKYVSLPFQRRSILYVILTVLNTDQIVVRLCKD